MDQSNHLVLFTLNDRIFALPLTNVERITRAAAITPLPSGPDIVIGVINLQGQVLPVVNIRKRFSMDDKPISTEDHFIVAKVESECFAILVDTVTDIIDYAEEEYTKNENELFNLPFIDGVVNKDQKMILIHDLKTLLSSEDIEAIGKAMDKTKKTKPKSKPKSQKPKAEK